MGGRGGRRIVKMNRPIVEIGPLNAVFIPLDFFPLVGSGSFIYVDLLKVFLVWEGLPEDFWVDRGVVVKGSPRMSSSLGIERFFSPTSKKDAVAVDVSCEVVLK